MRDLLIHKYFHTPSFTRKNSTEYEFSCTTSVTKRTSSYHCRILKFLHLASPIFPEKQSNLSDEERCARISTVIKKKDIAQNLYDAYTAALSGYSPDDDDLKEIKILHVDLQHAMREVSKLELCPLSSCKKHKIINFNSQIKRNAAHFNNHEHDNDGLLSSIVLKILNI
ncbi:hypothetical protein CDAR_505771 [Caerostris darwini]|uniref:Uncharacterized protein n=1 Tax=Caerostris darwini TaxID=1538125 RepID=A0AAV4WAF4_9ARAC|nr:hypothetical protein CDAR_505771 [Caerostris darwini]